jgi:hypothetical protein
MANPTSPQDRATNPQPQWRDTMRPVRILGLDVRAFAPWLLVVAGWYKLFGIAILTTIAFWVMERFGWTLDVAFRKTRSWIVGPNRPVFPPNRNRRLFRDP